MHQSFRTSCLKGWLPKIHFPSSVSPAQTVKVYMWPKSPFSHLPLDLLCVCTCEARGGHCDSLRPAIPFLEVEKLLRDSPCIELELFHQVTLIWRFESWIGKIYFSFHMWKPMDTAGKIHPRFSRRLWGGNLPTAGRWFHRWCISP